MKGRVFLAVLSLSLVGLAYFVYEPIPEGFPKPWQLRLILAMLKVMSIPIKVAEALGLTDEAAMSRYLGNLQGMESTHDLKILNTTFNGIPMRMYVPESKAPSLPAMFYIHGGGWTVGHPGLYDKQCAHLARSLQMVVTSIQYRLSPQHPFPAPLDDCVSAYKHLAGNADEYGVDPNRIAVAGDSAGGNLAAALSLRLRDEEFAVPPKVQVLIYPATQAFTFDSPSYKQNRDGPLLTKHKTIQFWSNYLFGSHKYLNVMMEDTHLTDKFRLDTEKAYMGIDKIPKNLLPKDYKLPPPKSGDAEVWQQIQHVITDPYVAPLAAKDLGSLPTAHIAVCQYDVLRDDGIWYAERLKKAGVKVNMKVYMKGFHGMFSFFDMFDEAIEMMSDIESYLRNNL